MTYISPELRQQVIERARACCEYCLLHQDDNYIKHEVDHIIAEKHRGETDLLNLCLSCFECNRYKGSDIGSIDVETNSFTPLFNPRQMNWDDHFQLQDELIMPLTAVGRVTEFLLRFNNDERLLKRRQLIELGRYPCI